MPFTPKALAEALTIRRTTFCVRPIAHAIKHLTYEGAMQFQAELRHFERLGADVALLDYTRN